MNLKELPRLCHQNESTCSLYRDCDWIEEMGLCIGDRCVHIIHADCNFEIFDQESYLRPKDRFFYRYLRQTSNKSSDKDE